MRTYDFSPLFRHSVGFDRMQHLLDNATRQDTTKSYPPYNIEQLDEDSYRITMAVAGFGEGDLDVSVEDNTLIVTGEFQKEEGETAANYLHRGIAERAFERRFQLADHIKVAGGSLNNGILNIELLREVPEEKKPKRIEISFGNPQKTVVDKHAA